MMLLEEILLGDEPHIAGLDLFENVIWEMDMNGGIISRERIIEMLGDIYVPCDVFESGLVFYVTSQLRVTARNFSDTEGVFSSIHISRSPMIMTDVAVILDEAVLISYAESPDVLTYEYLVELIGAPGRITSYSYSSFTYSWRSSDVLLNVNVDSSGVVRSMFIIGEETFDARLDNATPEMIRDVAASFAMLAHEMDDNNGYTTRDRVAELFGTDYSEERHETGFRLSFDIGFNLAVNASGYDDVIYSIDMWGLGGPFVDENLVIDGAAIREYTEAWWDIEREDRPNLRYFEQMFGRPGTIDMYSNGLFWHTWESQGYTVQISADRDGIVSFVSIHENFW
jgi:hypothetical protein